MDSLLDQLIGHDRIKKALSSPHLKTHHRLWLFWGPRGVGKFSLALGLAQLWNCPHRRPPIYRACGSCGVCRRIAQKNYELLWIIEPPKTKGLITWDLWEPVFETMGQNFSGHSPTIIVREAHLFHHVTVSRLLKTFEEMPDNWRIIFITPFRHQIWPPLRSRTLSVRFLPLSQGELSMKFPELPEGYEERDFQRKWEGETQRNNEIQASLVSEKLWEAIFSSHSTDSKIYAIFSEQIPHLSEEELRSVIFLLEQHVFHQVQEIVANHYSGIKEEAPILPALPPKFSDLLYASMFIWNSVRKKRLALKNHIDARHLLLMTLDDVKNLKNRLQALKTG